MRAVRHLDCEQGPALAHAKRAYHQDPFSGRCAAAYCLALINSGHLKVAERLTSVLGETGLAPLLKASALLERLGQACLYS
jgi:hypothetical protein